MEKEIKEPTPQELLSNYQNEFEKAKQSYKKCVANYDDAFDEYDEECLDEEMEKSKLKVKKFKAKIIALKEANPDLEEIQA